LPPELVAPTRAAQNPEMQQRVAEIKEAAAKNKQALSQLTWVEQVNISPRCGTGQQLQSML